MLPSLYRLARSGSRPLQLVNKASLVIAATRRESFSTTFTMGSSTSPGSNNALLEIGKSSPTSQTPLPTRILPLDASVITTIHSSDLSELTLKLSPSSHTTNTSLRQAAAALRSTSVPVAFPTETVYGLGADATRSDSVQGIYTAKNRPADNPLIVHICDLNQLRSLLRPDYNRDHTEDPIPSVYHPLIKRFWPGPLTILLPLTDGYFPLAPEVTAGLRTFGARMPSSPVALALIKLSQRPLAAPSANASTRPSPTAAAHVLHDLNGRIELILDGGECQVGVESTVVDGLSEPPAVLRPGGIGIQAIRACKGWESCVRGYRDADEAARDLPAETGKLELAPRAPGMKYKHYSPTARVVLVKSGLLDAQGLGDIIKTAANNGIGRIGILRGPEWPAFSSSQSGCQTTEPSDFPPAVLLEEKASWCVPAGDGGVRMELIENFISGGEVQAEVIDAHLGRTPEAVARNLFRGLREMDLMDVRMIFVEGLREDDGEESAAVMNRLRKAAEFTMNNRDEMVF